MEEEEAKSSFPLFQWQSNYPGGSLMKRSDLNSIEKKRRRAEKRQWVRRSSSPLPLPQKKERKKMQMRQSFGISRIKRSAFFLLWSSSKERRKTNPGANFHWERKKMWEVFV